MKRLFSLLFIVLFYNAQAQHLLYIPDTLSGTSFNLTVHADSVHFMNGAVTHTIGINNSSYLGPTLIMHKGDSISIAVNNNTGDTTTMHWHGLHVAPANDGGPFSMIMPGMTWKPQFVVRNNAATYWYHPHMMAKTAEQAIKGDMGMIIIRDAAEAELPLPRTYGVDDFPIIVQSVELDSANAFMPRGMADSIILVNGGLSPFVNMPSQVVRLRLLNASGERTMNFGFAGNLPFSVIANDNGLLPAPVASTRIWLSPGERAEVLVDLTNMNGQITYLKSYGSGLPMGVQGGPTMPMPAGSPDMNSPLNGIDYNLLQINVVNPTDDAIHEIPSALAPDTAYTVSSANTLRTINMTADSATVMDGPFYFNDSTFDMMRVDYRIPLNNTEIWTLSNQTMVAHPFHIHDVHFYIVDRDGNAPAPTERGRKDVVLIQPNETVRIIMKFEDFADTTIPYMYHCHILMHEDDGMMGQFVVGNYPTGLNTVVPAENISVYPNPATERFTIASDMLKTAHDIRVNCTDVLGNRLDIPYTAGNNQIVFNTKAIAAGTYFVHINAGTKSSVCKITKL